MPSIFISYRRADSAGWTGRLSEVLNRRFGAERVFYDLDPSDIPAGSNWLEAVNKKMRSCKAVVVVIGPRWLNATDGVGRRRLDDPSDPHRTEIVAAIDSRALVIPVLVGGATMPNPEDLPQVLRPVCHRQAHELSDRRWDYDCSCLVKELERTLGLPPAEAERPARPKTSGKAIAGVMLLVVIGLLGENLDLTTVAIAVVLCIIVLALSLSALTDIKQGKAKGKLLAISTAVLSGFAVVAMAIGVLLGRAAVAPTSGLLDAIPSELTPQTTPLAGSMPNPPEMLAQQLPPPSNTCPVVQGMFWMQFPDTWYGAPSGGDAVSFSGAGGFFVWDPKMLNLHGTYGAVIPYPDPDRLIPRNVWIPLRQSGFSVCVDGSANVFGSHGPALGDGGR